MQIYYEFFILATISSPNMTRDSNELKSNSKCKIVGFHTTVTVPTDWGEKLPLTVHGTINLHQVPCESSVLLTYFSLL